MATSLVPAPVTHPNRLYLFPIASSSCIFFSALGARTSRGAVITSCNSSAAVMEPVEATPFLSRSSRISRSNPSLPATRETEEKYRPASRAPFPVSSATAPETSSYNSRQTWLHREQQAGVSFVSSNQSSSSTSPPAAASPGKSFFPDRKSVV